MTRTQKMLASLAVAACTMPALARAQEHAQPTTPAPAASETAPTPPASTPPPASSEAPPPPPTEPKVKPPPEKKPVEHHITAPIVAAGIISGVALVGGVVFAVKASSDHGKYVSEPDVDTANSGDQAAFYADVLFGFSALFAFGAVMLYLLPDEQTASAKSSPLRYVKSALGGMKF